MLADGESGRTYDGVPAVRSTTNIQPCYAMPHRQLHCVLPPLDGVDAAGRPQFCGMSQAGRSVQVVSVMDCHKLIELVRDCPLLYDLDHPEFKNLYKKTEAWNKVGKALNVEGEAAKKKWRNLRDCYLKSKKYCKENQVKNKYRKWPWIDHLLFLDKSSPLIIKQSPDDDTYPDTGNPPGTCSTAPSENSISQLKFPRKSSKLQLASKKIKKNEDNGIDRVVQHSTTENNIPNTLDEVDLLFASYAKTFKRFSRMEQATLKVELANIFYQAELNHSKKQDSSLSGLLYASSSDEL